MILLSAKAPPTPLQPPPHHMASHSGCSPHASPRAQQEQHKVTLALGTGQMMGPSRAGFLFFRVKGVPFHDTIQDCWKNKNRLELFWRCFCILSLSCTVLSSKTSSFFNQCTNINQIQQGTEFVCMQKRLISMYNSVFDKLRVTTSSSSGQSRAFLPALTVNWSSSDACGQAWAAKGWQTHSDI